MFQKAAVYARDVLSTIGELVRALRDLKDAITKATETAKAQTRLQPEVAVRAEGKLAEGVVTRKSAADTADDKKYQRRSLTVTWWTFGAIVLYAAISAFQLREMHITTREAEDAMRLDQRAWLGVDNIPSDVKVGEFFSAVIQIKNTGKTPANNMHFAATLDPKNTTPNVSVDCADAIKITKRALVTPGGVHSIPAKGEPWGKLHENWVQEMGDKMVYVHGCVLYDDIFKQRHWLTFCHRWRNEIPAFENCEAGNDTGDGNGPK